MGHPDRYKARTVSTKAGMYVLGPNEPVVIGGLIRGISAATNGRYALVIQQVSLPVTSESKILYGEEKLWLYDAYRRTSKLLHRVTDNPIIQKRMHLKIHWFPERSRALIIVTDGTYRSRETFEEPISMHFSCGLLDAERKSFRRFSAPFEGNFQVETLRDSSTLLLIGDQLSRSGESPIVFVSPEGKFSPVRYLECSPDTDGLFLDGLLPQSNEAVLRTEILPPNQKSLKSIWYLVHLSTSAVRSLYERPKEMISVDSDSWEKHEPLLPLILEEENTKLVGRSGSEAETTALWLRATEPGTEKKKTEALVAVAPYPQFRGIDESVGIDCILLSDLSAVLYLHEGDLYATSLTKKP